MRQNVDQTSWMSEKKLYQQRFALVNKHAEANANTF